MCNININIRISIAPYRDDGSLLEETADDLVVNEGNFRELLRFRIASGDSVLANHLRETGAKATYISKTIQNQLLDCCRQEIMSIILNYVTSARLYSVMFDETTDISHTSQMSLVLRYVLDGNIREDFVGFIDPHDYNYKPSDSAIGPTEPTLTGEVLGKTVINLLQSMNLNLAYCVGIGTDGCSVMASQQCGAVMTIMTEAKNAIRCPCFNHALNLSVSKSSDVQSVRNAVGVMREVISFFTSSSKRNFVLKHANKGQLIGMCETRWVERHDAVLQFKTHLGDIVNSLTVVASWEEGESAAKARSLELALCNTEFIITLFALSDVVSVTMPLSKLLQKTNIDVQSAMAIFQDTVAVLEARRTNVDIFNAIFTEATAVMTELDLEVALPRLSKRQKNRPNPPAETPYEYYSWTVYYPILDAIITDLKDRFKPQIRNALELNYLIPANIMQSFSSQFLVTVLSQYGALVSALEKVEDSKVVQLTEQKLKGEIEVWRQKWMSAKLKNVKLPKTAMDALAECDPECYPNVHHLLQILVTLPVSVASAERTFSTLRRLKTWLRSRMGEERQTGLALLNIHRDIVVDTENIINRFASSGKRNLDFVL